MVEAATHPHTRYLAIRGRALPRLAYGKKEERDEVADICEGGVETVASAGAVIADFIEQCHYCARASEVSSQSGGKFEEWVAMLEVETLLQANDTTHLASRWTDTVYTRRTP